MTASASDCVPTASDAVCETASASVSVRPVLEGRTRGRSHTARPFTLLLDRVGTHS